MSTTTKQASKAKQSLLLTDDTLKERFGDTPLFTGKIEKATAIMELVRAQQRKQQSES